MQALLLALLVGCSSSTPEPRQPGPQAARSAKAKAPRAKAAKAKAKAKAKAGKANRPQRKVGAAGPIVGELALTQTGEGDATKTRAQLKMRWEGGEHTALLGVTKGTCKEVEPREVTEGVEAMWWAECTFQDMKGDYAILETGGYIVVQRQITRSEQTGEWVTVHRVPLADGAELTAGEIEDTPAGEGDAPSEEPAQDAEEPEAKGDDPAPAPAPEPAPQ